MQNFLKQDKIIIFDWLMIHVFFFTTFVFLLKQKKIDGQQEPAMRNWKW